MEVENEVVRTDEDGGLVIPVSEIRRIVPNPTVYLADGTKLKGSAALNSDNNDLWVWINPESGKTMAELFALFNDPSKTSIIKTTHLDTDTPIVYEGFTRMNVIKMDYSDQVSVRMIKA